MLRGVILGALAFGTVFVAERQFGAVAQDIARYNSIRAMSGDPPLSRQLFSVATKFMADYGASRGVTAGDFIRMFSRDVVRYALMRTM